MKVIHIESGLGNQMLSYCEYLAMRKVNPTDDIYIETAIYELPECNEVICQWNGYELERIFNIKAPNIKETITNEQWNKFLESVRKSKFWNKNWNYPKYFTKAFISIGINIKSIHDDFDKKEARKNHESNYVKSKIKSSRIYSLLKFYWRKYIGAKINNHRISNRLYIESKEDIFAGQQLLFKHKGSNIELIEDEIRACFKFPCLRGEKNLEIEKKIKESESVAVHARRGDMLKANSACYEDGYFLRATKYIKRKTKKPVFFIFCEEGSMEWVKKNCNVLGLNSEKDLIYYIDWNSTTDSYIDMQLMSLCKHQIITNSSFGWWAAWLNTYKNKITCSPDPLLNTTHTI